jgi:hypothetical protein
MSINPALLLGKKVNIVTKAPNTLGAVHLGATVVNSGMLYQSAKRMFPVDAIRSHIIAEGVGAIAEAEKDVYFIIQSGELQQVLALSWVESCTAPDIVTVNMEFTAVSVAEAAAIVSAVEGMGGKVLRYEYA